MTDDGDRAADLMLLEPLSAFNGKTAVELALEGRLEDVVAYLESLRTGAAG